MMLPRKKAKQAAGALECFLCAPTAVRAITRSMTQKGCGFARTAANRSIRTRVLRSMKVPMAGLGPMLAEAQRASNRSICRGLQTAIGEQLAKPA